MTDEMKLLPRHRPFTHSFNHTCVLHYANVALGGSGRARPQRQQDFKRSDSHRKDVTPRFATSTGAVTLAVTSKQR